MENKKNRTRELVGQFKIVLIFLAMCIILTILKPTFFSVSNIINVLRQISIIAIISMGSTMIIISGGIDLSPGSIAGVTGIIAAMLSSSGMPVIVPVLAGLLAGALCGLFNGAIIAKGNIPPFIVTLGMMTIGRGLAYVLSDGKPISGLSSSFLVLGRSSVMGIPVPIIIMVLAVLLTWMVMDKRVFGKHVYALGGNENAARVSGVNVDLVKIKVYVFAGLMAGLGGVVLASRIATGHPNSGNGYEMDAIASTVIGGTSLSGGVGTIGGTVVGALIIGVLNNGLDLLGVSAYYQQIAKGLIIIAAVLMDQKTKSKTN